ncbi:PLP-dependent aminotransferase family protein [Bacillus sp. CGMCC 1.16607]|uniref:MocR-like pyridoxine biosynthesis transcription factor PdxR n=1 Tax=Bacillus sp. CGMCC 1.16607 TaxID=3351842 RepID=UPI003636B343
MERTPFLDENSSTPLYVQLYEYFKNEIENQRIPMNSKLPSIRQLALHLKISRNTVETAYQQLHAEGYVESKPKSGLIVVEIEDVFISTTTKKEQISPVLPQKEQTYIDFQYGEIDASKFPIKEWKKCLVNVTNYSYGDKQGHIGLREEIATYLFQSRGVECQAEDILLCAGTQASILLLTQLLHLFNQKVAFENPGYDGARLVFQRQQCEMIPISIEDDGVNIHEVEKSGAKALYLTPSHQFPLGMVLSITKRKKLLQWAEKENSYLIEDDYDSEFRYLGQPIPSLKSLDFQERVIYLGTFSKAFLPATRVSYIVLPKTIMQKYKNEFHFLNQSVSPIIQEALYQFMKKGEFAKHIRRMRKCYQMKHKVLLNSLNHHFGHQINIIGQKAGLHLLVQLHGQAAEELIFKAESVGVKVYPTNTFWLNPMIDDGMTIMLGYGGLSEYEIELGVQKLKFAWLG